MSHRFAFNVLAGASIGTIVWIMGSMDPVLALRGISTAALAVLTVTLIWMLGIAAEA